MPCCCAVGCKNRAEKGFRMFRLPSDATRKKIWLSKIRRDAWTPTRYSMLCEAHFDSSQFESNRQDGRKLLKPFAVPEIFPHRPVKPTRKAPLRREVKEKPMEIEICQKVVDVEPQHSAVEMEGHTHSVSDMHIDHSLKSNGGDDDSDKDEVIRRLKLKVSSLQRKVVKLEVALEETTRALHSFLNPDQVQSLGKKSNKGQKWSNSTVKKALQIRFASGIKGYNNLINLGFPLPSDRTLSRRLEDFQFLPGIQMEVFEFLKLKASILNEKERYCVLLLDEMVIEQKIELDRSSKSMYGYTTLPQSKEISTHALVFMLAGVSTRWKQTVAYHFTGNSFPSTKAKEIILQIIKLCYDVGLTVICVTCDMGSCNRGVWKEFGITCGKYCRTVNSIPHPCKDELRIYFMADVCHVLKNIRNHLLEGKCIFLPDKVVQKNGFTTNRVCLQPVKELLKIQADRDIKIVPKLTESHVYVKQFQKMRVRMAVELMSTDVAAAIKYCVKEYGWSEEYLATAWFFDLIDKWFSLMCSRNPVMALSRHKVDIYDAAIEFLKEFIEIFDEIKVGDGKWKPVQTGVKLTTRSILDLQNFLFNGCSFGYILTSRFCQDSLENLFSTVRVKNPIPSPVQFKNAIKIISIAQFMVVPSKSNCEEDEGSLLAEFLDVAGNKLEVEENLEEQLEGMEQDFAMDTLHANALYHFCGFVVRQIDRKLQCSLCSSVMHGDGSDVDECDKQFLLCKEQSKGSLVRSSRWSWELAKEAENVFYARKGVLSKSGLNVIDYFCNAMYVENSEKIVTCHNLRALFLKKYFRMRIDMYSKNLSRIINKGNESLGHGSRSVHMRKVIK